MFGSAANGSYSESVSDVDLILIGNPAELRAPAARLEIEHGFALASNKSKNALEKLAERSTGHAMSTFICTRANLLTGDVGKILNLHPIQAFFVDRIVLNGILSSARTVWGEDLLPQVPRLPIRKLDVYKSLFNSLNVMTMCIIGYPFLPEATKYAMGALKHALHSCYYCHHLQTASLTQEIAYFGPHTLLDDLQSKRLHYSRDFTFALRCIPFLIRLYLSRQL